MAKQESIVQFTGKVGELVGQKTIKGDLMLRKRSTSVKVSESEASIIARLKFGTLNATAASLSNVLVGLSKYASANRITLRNAFMKKNYDEIVRVTPPTFDQVDYEVNLGYENAILAQGTATNPTFGRINTETPQTVRVTFNTSGFEGMIDDNDAVYLIAYSVKMDKAFIGSVKASSGEATLNLPGALSGEEVHVWAFTQHFNNINAAMRYWAASWTGTAGNKETIDNSDFSNSIYIGSATIS